MTRRARLESEMSEPVVPLRLPPWPVLTAVAVVAALRGLPWLVLRSLPGPAGSIQLPLPFVPKDWLVYVAFVIAPADPGSTWLSNPYTTEPQDGRFILLLHQLLGAVHGLTGLSGGLLLEAVRPPLLLVLAITLWWFLGPIFSDQRERQWAALLVLLSGGVHGVVVAAARGLPGWIPELLVQDLRQVNGWSTFESAFNPVWLAGLSLLLVVVGLALRRGPVGWRGGVALAGALVTLWCTHAYSAVASLAIVGAALVAELLLGEEGWAGRGERLAWLVAGLLAVVAVALWQRGDPVFRATAGGFFGKQGLPPSWYPLTLGALLPLALLGLAGWAKARHPWRLVVGGWLVAVALLHGSDLVNGYHFVPYLHIPVAIAAAPALVRSLDRWRRFGDRVRPAVLLLALVVGAPLATWDAVRTRSDSQLDAGAVAVVERLGRLPPGRVLAPVEVGQLVPGLAGHRTFLGHWFMTPGHGERRALLDRLLARPEAEADAWRRLVSEARIDYVVTPEARAGAVEQALGGAVAARGREGDWAILLIRREGSPTGPRLP
jgi:hypothetical protein